MKRVLPAIPLVILALAATGLTYWHSLQAAPAAGYQAPPLDTSLIEKPEAPVSARKLTDHLYMVGGLKVVHVWGSPREMGRQHGRAVADDIKAAYEKYMHQHVEVDGKYPLEYQRACAAAMEKHIPAAYIEEMKGVAEGAGVTYDQVLRLHCHADMVHFGHEWGQVTDGRQRKTAQASEAGEEGAQLASAGLGLQALCSNFVAFGPATIGGKVYHGRNLDWGGAGVQQWAILLIAEPKGGVPFALMSYAGAIGGVTGMNAEGITFGEMTSSTADETLDGMPLFFACRRILDSCRDLKEVEEFVKTYPGTTGWTFMVADGEAGDARVFEVDAQRRVVFRPDDPTENDPPISSPIPHAIRRTNHPIAREVQLAALARIGMGNIELGKVVLPTMDTWQRYTSLGQWISKDHHGRIDERIARAMLQTPPVAGGGNLHSAVFNATDRVMWAANATAAEPAYKQPYYRIDLQEWIGKRG